MKPIESDVGEDVFDDDDDNFTLDMSSVEEAKREVIPAGTYPVVIASLDYARSQSSNQPMWSIQLEIEEGTFAGRKIYTNLSFSPKALGMSKAVLRVIAPELAEGSFNPKQIADNGDLLGRRAKVKTKLEAYQGEKQTRVSRWLPSTDSTNAFIG